ncbi:MAG: helix-turn-helix domain-containing protein [Chthoniobacteraceae bacterium]
MKHARLAKNITVEQAAHATKIRAERIRDLEVDDFTNFPNLTYAKGFLVIYAKYLGVDVSDFTGTLVGARNVGVEDYEYLQKAAPRSDVSTRPTTKSSPWPVLLGLGMAFMVIVGVFIVPKLWQIGDLDTGKASPSPSPTALEEPTATPAMVAVHPPISTPSPVSTPATPIPVIRAEPVQTPAPEITIATPPSATATPTPEASVEVRRAEPVNPLPVATPSATPAPNSLITLPPQH